jgi:hypothetical protein
MKSIKQHILEKLKVSKKYIGDINLVDFVNCDNLIEYEALLEKLRKEIKETAELAPIKQGSDKLYRVVPSDPNIIYIFINKHSFFIGTYDNMYFVFDNSKAKKITIHFEQDGFKDFTTNDDEMNQYGGVYILPEYLEESYNKLIEHAEKYM